jgi:methyltransferase
VITRLSLHHFVEPEKPFREMQRVLKKGGKLVIWDMVATTEELRETNDAIETMRDNSHTRILSREEFEALFEDAFELQLEETTLVPVNLQSWMDLTSTPEDIQKDIIDKMEYDLNGGDKTGFNPYIKEGQICFDHRWLLLIGKKEN